jgi:hypothetical protein
VSPQLPSAANLIDSFLKDLQGIASLFSGQGGARPTVQKTLWCASATATLTADRDCVIVGVAPLVVGAFVLATAPTTVANVALANNTTFDVIAACTSPTSLFASTSMRWKWVGGTKIYLVSTVGMGLLLTLET